jgi:hypothetical protein
MTTAAAVAAVTQVLRSLLYSALDSFTDVTVRSPDKARGSQTGDQLNVFLFQVTPNAAWRNRDLPQSRSGDAPRPLLPLNLLYLLTAYGSNDDEVAAQLLLGRALLFLHENPILDRGRITALTAGTPVADSGLERQVESVRFTFHPYTGDDLARIWAGFKTEYRLTVAYEAAAVLIDDDRPGRAAPPVIERSAGDRGPEAAAGQLGSPYPELTGVKFPTRVHTGVRLGEELVLTGNNLVGDEVRLRFYNPLLRPDGEAFDDVVIPPGQRDPTTIHFPLVVDPPLGPAGVYTVSAVVATRRPDPAEPSANVPMLYETARLPFAVLPRLVADDTAGLPVTAESAQVLRLELKVKPDVQPRQRIQLLLGDRAFAPESFSAGTATLVFLLPNPPGPLPLYTRLRVDGAESILVELTGDEKCVRKPPRYDPRLRLHLPGGGPP